jgi:hypothetical protein
VVFKNRSRCGSSAITAKGLARSNVTGRTKMSDAEAKLAKAVKMLEREIRRVQKIQRDLPPPHKVGLIYVEAEYELMLAELKGQNDE